MYYSHTRKDNSKVYRCSEIKYKKECSAYIILNSNKKCNRVNNNLSHFDLDKKQKRESEYKKLIKVKIQLKIVMIYSLINQYK